MKFPRFIHCLYAFLGGYFWLPCPLCGENFGGHEWHTHNENSSIMTSRGTGEGVCPNCHDEAKKYNDEWVADNKALNHERAKSSLVREVKNNSN